jgi:23S rRNA (guanosine2251-2'-O)-methyltransferase
MTEIKDDILYGFHPVVEALKAGRPIEKILLKRGLAGNMFREIRQRAAELDIPFQMVTIDTLNRLSRKNHQGIIALVSPVEYQDLEEVLTRVYEEGEDPFLLLLDGITDTRNLGAIARTALCAGVHALIVPQKNTARMGADAMKSSAGALNEIPVCRVKTPGQAVKLLKESGMKILAASEKGRAVYHEKTVAGPVVLVMGSEEKGIHHEILEMADSSIRIPLLGPIQSLNVSVATGILLFELAKQRAANKGD